MTRCRSCKAEVIWGSTLSGRRMCVNAEPSDYGNLVRSESEGEDGPVFHVADLWDPPGPRYVSHFATCPHADEWRRP